MITWIPVIAAFGVVAGMLCFLAYCSAAFDEEARTVEEFHRKNRPSETDHVRPDALAHAGPRLR